MEDTAPNHKARGHSELGASICSRWWNCPGSVALTRGMPDRETEASRRGTAAHELAQICLQEGMDAIEGVGRVWNGVEIDAALADAVQVYLDECRSVPEGCRTWVEVQFDLSPLKPPVPMFGTADFVAYDPATQRLYVKDYKNGFLHVDEGTPQLRYYAVGAILALGRELNVRSIEVTVVQPNGLAGAVRRATYTVGELASWSAELVRRAHVTQAPDAKLAAGSWCKFCPAAGTCPAQADAALAVARLEFADVVSSEDTALALPELPASPGLTVATVEELAAVKAKGAQLRAWLDAVDDVIEAELKAGRTVPGFKLVAGDAHRKWSADDPDTGAALCGLGIKERYERKLISPAKAETALAEILPGATKKARLEEAKAKIARLAVKPPGAAKVVPDTDPRPALPAPGTEFDSLPAT